MVTVWKAVKENMKMTINKGEEKKNGTRKRERGEVHIENYGSLQNNRNIVGGKKY